MKVIVNHNRTASKGPLCFPRPPYLHNKNPLYLCIEREFGKYIYQGNTCYNRNHFKTSANKAKIIIGSQIQSIVS